MEFSYAWTQEYVGKKLPTPQRLADLLTVHSFEIEHIEKIGGDTIMSADILPNRAHDALSHIGFARECAALIGASLKKPAIKPLVSSGTAPIRVAVRDKKRCPRYMAAVMRGVAVGPSPAWLAKRLRALGFNSINNVVDATNYVMLETGQPLHAFDMDKIEGGIVVRPARQGEKITTLDGSLHTLDSSHLIIADNKDALAIAGVKGGTKAEVDDKTTTVVLEAAYFDPVAVRKTSRALGLQTDSSYRFLHDVPIVFPPRALARAAGLVGELAGGKQTGKVVDIVSKKPHTTVLVLHKEYMDRLLGADIPMQHASGILKRLGFDTAPRGRGALTVRMPAFRLDIEREEDLIEEVARMYGYSNIKPQMPRGELRIPRHHDLRAWDRLAKRALAGLGASETYSLSFVSEREKDIWQYGKELIEIENPISKETRYLRPSLLPGLLTAGVRNTNVGKSGVLFELGHVFSQGGEGEHVGIIAFADTKNASLFYRIKGIVEGLYEGMRIAEVWFDPEDGGQSARIKVGKKEVGWIGMIRPSHIRAYKGRGGYAAAELDFAALRALAEEEYIYEEPSKYPAVVRDVSVLVPAQTRVGAVMDLIYASGDKHIQDIDLFDIYGENMAFHIVFQAKDRTLTSQEVDEAMKKITYTLQERGYTVR